MSWAQAAKRVRLEEKQEARDPGEHLNFDSEQEQKLLGSFDERRDMTCLCFNRLYSGHSVEDGLVAQLTNPVAACGF